MTLRVKDALSCYANGVGWLPGIEGSEPSTPAGLLVYESHHGKPPDELEAALLAEFRRRDLGDQPQAVPGYAKVISKGRRIKVTTTEWTD